MTSIGKKYLLTNKSRARIENHLEKSLVSLSQCSSYLSLHNNTGLNLSESGIFAQEFSTAATNKRLLHVNKTGSKKSFHKWESIENLPTNILAENILEEVSKLGDILTNQRQKEGDKDKYDRESPKKGNELPQRAAPYILK